jgi:phosphoglycerate dehydrogenase-like enzyme
MYKPAKLIASARNLQWIHVLSAGFDGIIGLPEVCGRRMTITST